MSSASFPIEILYLIMTQAVLEGDKRFVQADRLMQNGEARDNPITPRLLLVNKSLSQLAKELMWRRVGVCRIDTRKPIRIHYFRMLSELYPYKNHLTRSINISLELSPRELLDKPRPAELIHIAVNIFKASRPDQINEVVLWIKNSDSHNFTDNFWERFHPILEITADFKNLTRFEFSFSQTFWQQETKLASVIRDLKNLEVIKLCAQSRSPLGREPDLQRHLGNSLSSLTELKQISLEGLQSPNPNWIELSWRSNIEKLSITKCEGFKEFSTLRIFLNFFRKSLIALRIEVEENYCEALEDCEILKSFESLKHLTIFQNHHRNISILQQFSICPTIKYINWMVSDLNPSNQQIRSLVFDLFILKNYQNRWSSLRSLIIPSSFEISLDHSTNAMLDTLCNNFSIRLSCLDDDRYDKI